MMTTTLLLLSCLLSASLVHAYTYDVQIGTLVMKGQSSGVPATWQTLPLPLASQLGAPYDEVVDDAAARWNALVPVFTVDVTAVTVVRWGLPGEIPFGMMAFTRKVLLHGKIIHAEVLLDPLVCWDVYTGPLRSTLCDGVWSPLHDVARVVLHELGHVAGLDHPDEGGQTVVALMNSVESDLETLTADDAAGIHALYDAPPHSAAQTPRMASASGGGGCAMQTGSDMDAGALVLLALFYVWHGWKKLRP